MKCDICQRKAFFISDQDRKLCERCGKGLLTYHKELKFHVWKKENNLFNGELPNENLIEKFKEILLERSDE